MNMEQQLSRWDGKSTEQLELIYRQHYEQSGFAEQLLVLLAKSELQRGASWLLKKALASGTTLSLQQSARFYTQITLESHWETRLHLLQSLPHLPVSDTDLSLLEPVIRHSLKDTKTFTRAWAYSAFYQLAILFPHYRKEAQSLMEQGLEYEAASVKARIRNVIKQMGPLDQAGDD